jgi:hypothetical protein
LCYGEIQLKEDFKRLGVEEVEGFRLEECERFRVEDMGEF